MKKLQTEKDTEKQMREEEKLYRKDFWSSARNVTNGTFGTQSSQPTFEKSTADEYYKNKYENATIIDYDELKWFPKVDKPSVSYNLSPYRPKDIKHALYKKSNNSAPGEDDIVYHYLKKMPYLHKVLATTFTEIREKGVAPKEWAQSKVILIKKDENGADDDFSNFRMISLTLNIGKLYHTLESQMHSGA